MIGIEEESSGRLRLILTLRGFRADFRDQYFTRRIQQTKMIEFKSSPFMLRKYVS